MRDIDEDADIGRLYLPREALTLAGIESNDPKTVVANPQLGTACAYLVERARGHFTKADEIMSRFPAQRVRAPKIMGAVYRQMLEDMVSRGWALPRTSGSRQQIVFAVGCFAACIRLTRVRSTSLVQVWRGWPPPNACRDRVGPSPSMKRPQ